MALASIWLQSARPRSGSRPGKLAAALVLLAALALLSTLVSHLLYNGYLSQDALHSYARLLVMRDASGLRLEYAGFLSPQVALYLNYLISLLPGLEGAVVPYLLDIAAVSVLATLLWRDLARTQGHVWALVWTLLLIAHPFTLWTATAGFSAGLGLLAFYCLCRTLRHFQGESQLKGYLRFAGWLCLLFFIDERALFIALAILPWMVLVAPSDLLRRAPLAFYLVCFVPFILALFSWAYLNWVYYGEGLRFLLDPDSRFRGGLGQAHALPWLSEVGGTWWPALAWLAMIGLPAFPSILLAPWGRVPGSWAATAVSAASVLGAGTIASWLWFASHPVLFLSLLLVPAAIGLRATRPGNRPLVTVALLGGLMLAWLMIFRVPVATLTHWTMALQHPVDLDPHDELELGTWLAQSRMPTMIDDRAAFAVIAARRDAKDLVLPFSDEFRIALASPDRLPAQIVIAAPGSPQGSQDAINRRFPQIWREGHPGYQLVYEQEVWRVWQRQQ